MLKLLDGLKTLKPKHKTVSLLPSICASMAEHHRIAYLHAVADKTFCETAGKAAPPEGLKIADVKNFRLARSGTPE